MLLLRIIIFELSSLSPLICSIGTGIGFSTAFNPVSVRSSDLFVEKFITETIYSLNGCMYEHVYANNYTISD